MGKKIAYSLVGIFLLSAGLFAYHFIAANNAEQSLGKTLQEISRDSQGKFTINYSSIDVQPFSGDVIFSDLNIIRNQDIQRTSAARLDLAYTDFLNFMIRGTESGLKQVSSGNLKLENISYTNRQTFLEVKVDSLDISYTGNLWDLIVLGLTGQSTKTEHKFDGVGNRFRFYQPENGIGTLQADSLEILAQIGNSNGNPDSLYNQLTISGINWAPPPGFQEKYQFFIRGFGYQADSIPLEEIDLKFRDNAEDENIAIDFLTVNSELFTITLDGEIQANEDQFSQSKLQNTTIRLYEMSPRFRQFLQQLEDLIGLQIPGKEEELQVQLNGPLSNPKLTFQL